MVGGRAGGGGEGGGGVVNCQEMKGNSNEGSKGLNVELDNVYLRVLHKDYLTSPTSILQVPLNLCVLLNDEAKQD